MVIDELGFTPFDLVGANHPFRLVSAAYETRTLVITSNWAFEQWTNSSPTVTAATAILDRVLHHCQVVVLDAGWGILVARPRPMSIRSEAVRIEGEKPARCRR